MKSLMQFMKRFLNGYYKETVLAPLLKLCEASFELLVPLVMAAIIDTGIAGGDRPYIYKMCGVLIFLAVFGLVISITAQWFAAKAATGFARQLRHALFAHIQELSYSQIDQLGTDTLITRMTSDVNQAQTGLNLVLRLLLRSPFIVVGAMIMAFTVDVQAAVIFAVVIPVLGLVVFLIMRWTLPRYKKVQENLDHVTTATRENLTGARVIRAFGRQEHEIETFQHNNDGLASLQQFVGSVSGLMNPLTYLIVNLATAVLIYAGAVRVDIGALTQGQVVALLNYMSQILVELIKMANLIIQTSRAIACGGRLSAILSIEPDMTCAMTPEDSAMSEEGIIPDADRGACAISGEEIHGTAHAGERSASGISGTSQEAAVEFRNVSLTYAGAAGQALTDISFKARQGDTIGIIGGTGSGKTSLVNLIPRFYDVTQGQVLVFGRDVRSYRQKELRSRIGVVPQRAELFRGTIRDNLSWGKDDPTEEEMQEALAAAQAKEFVDQKPGGTAFELDQNGRNLSGGQRQRMTIARALIRRPEILILDDSASALDFATDAKLRAAIREFSAGSVPSTGVSSDAAQNDDTSEGPEGRRATGLTTFIVSQRAASVQYADLILVMDEGRIAGAGTHDELLERCAVYQEIYYSQFPKEEVI